MALSSYTPRTDIEMNNLPSTKAATTTSTTAEIIHAPEPSTQTFAKVLKSLASGGWITFAGILVTNLFPLLWVYASSIVHLAPQR